MSEPLSDERLAVIRRDFGIYEPHQLQTFERGWTCCSAHAPADYVRELLVEVDRLRAANANLIRNAEVLADELVLTAAGEPDEVTLLRAEGAALAEALAEEADRG